MQGLRLCIDRRFAHQISRYWSLSPSQLQPRGSICLVNKRISGSLPEPADLDSEPVDNSRDGHGAMLEPQSGEKGEKIIAQYGTYEEDQSSQTRNVKLHPLWTHMARVFGRLLRAGRRLPERESDWLEPETLQPMRGELPAGRSNQRRGVSRTVPRREAGGGSHLRTTSKRRTRRNAGAGR